MVGGSCSSGRGGKVVRSSRVGAWVVCKKKKYYEPSLYPEEYPSNKCHAIISGMDAFLKEVGCCYLLVC